METWVQTFNGRNPTRMVLCTRDDLIRLVVGMQWREAMLHTTVDAFGWVKETRIRPWSDTRPASDIVDEWLGVK
jgi:hypothetical protein